MAKVYTSQADEDTIKDLQKNGLRATGHKWMVLRLALAHSLRLPTPPDDGLDRRDDIGSEYAMDVVTGEGKPDGQDLTDQFRVLLSVYHSENLFSDPEIFVRYLQRHIRRGLREFRSSWREGHDFHEFLYQEWFARDVAMAKPLEDVSGRVLAALREIGVTAEILECREGPRVTRYTIQLPDANDLPVLQRGVEKLAFVLGLGEAGVFTAPGREARTMFLTIPRRPETWRMPVGRDLWQWLEKAPSDWRLPVFPGVDEAGEPVGFDLAAAPHLLIGGTTGSGKSVALHALILSLLKTCSPSQVRLVLIDPKQVEFAPYRELSYLWNGEVITGTRQGKTVLEELVVEMESRQALLAAGQARDWAEGLANGRIDAPFIVVCIEELADLLMQDRTMEDSIIRLAQKARASGIHLVLATQRPDAATFSGLLRSNVPSRMALTVAKGAESRVILDENGAEKLLGRGDMLLKLIGQDTRRVHGVWISRDDIAQTVREARQGRSA
ncbi:FtsK/SpoIIIE domain-containing protein [Methylocaldum sp.]|uniref:FtsK/SpoIIIE domain-containing protein n=1 Tax=Methylocaldum sp. TaxID=1969727 RepID=UPI002D3A0946|nr:FtsK/SpoIIIE domain-containing protein [Methylocaldum sp.]HYE36009.1 FtsK/SpoIIIE domain-containing protein [Methylocaldum sp.]